MSKAKQTRFSFVMVMMVALGLALIPGCTESSTVNAPTQECSCTPTNAFGARLQPVTMLYNDGTSVVDAARFWDTERNETCSTVRTDAGVFCLPDFVWNTKPGYFVDSDCTQPVAVVARCDKTPRYIRDDTSKPYETCEPRPLEALLPLGEPMPPAIDLYAISANVCTKTTTTDAANTALLIGPPVPISAFAAAAVVPSAAF